MAQAKPQVIDDEEHERVYERVAAVDVAKDTGMVCTRTPHPSRPGARQSTVWTVKARMNAIRALGRQLKRDGIEMVTLESTLATTGKGRFTGWRPRGSSASWPTPSRSSTCPAGPSGTRRTPAGWLSALSAARSGPASCRTRSSASSGCTPATGGT